MMSMASFEVKVATIALVISFVASSLHAYDEGFVPGESTVYSDYNGTAAPYPANNTGPIYPTANGPAGADDVLFQNLLDAEWIVFNFYQQGVEAFTTSNFTDKGYKASTYERIAAIRDNEAGHLVTFQESISSTSLKPGQCKYSYGFDNEVTTYLVTQTVIEVVSMTFLTALILEAELNSTKGALVAIAEVEGRHLTWGLIDVWDVDPFSGPVDTIYPYVNQIFQTVKQFIIPGSCPKENTPFPTSSQNLPQLSNAGAVLVPGDNITFTYSNASHVPTFKADQKYYAVFYHGALTVSVPFDVENSSSVIPEFENRGIIVAVIADSEGAPTEDSVLAGPLFIVLQPPGFSI